MNHEPIRQSEQHSSPPVLHQLWGLLLSASPLPNPTRAPLFYYLLLLLLHAPEYDAASADVSCPGRAGGEW